MATGQEVKRTSRQHTHPLLALVVEDIQPLLILPASAFPLLPESFSYFESVFRTATRLAGALDELRQARILMVAFPPGDALRRASMGRANFVHYHLSHYRVALLSMRDRGLELTNAALSLGRKSTQLRLDNMERRVPSDVWDALQRLHRATERHTESRNDFVHRGEILRIPDLERIEMTEFV